MLQQSLQPSNLKINTSTSSLKEQKYYPQNFCLLVCFSLPEKTYKLNSQVSVVGSIKINQLLRIYEKGNTYFNFQQDKRQQYAKTHYKWKNGHGPGKKKSSLISV